MFAGYADQFYDIMHVVENIPLLLQFKKYGPFNDCPPDLLLRDVSLH